MSLPNDFRTYLLNAAPQEDFIDGDIIWWSPGRLKNIPEEYRDAISNPVIAGQSASCLFFADYCIWCWAWAICCGADEHHGKVTLVNGVSDRWASASFSEFVALYVQDRRLN